MKSFKQFKLFYLFIAAMMLVSLFAGPAAFALMAAQQTEIEDAVATGDPAVIEAITKAIIKAAIIDGEDPASIAQEVTSIAVAAATSENIVAVTQAACKGTAAAAVEAAVDTGQDVVTVVQEVSSGSTAGSIQAASDAANQDEEVINAVTVAANTGLIAGATEAATSANLSCDVIAGATEAATSANLSCDVIAAVTQAVQKGSSQGETLVLGQIVSTPQDPQSLEEPEAFEPASAGSPAPPAPTIVETPPTQDGAAASPI